MPRSAIDLIYKRSALAYGFVAERSGDPEIALRGLERMRLLLAAAGDPHLAYPTVHVAGSKGKGTTTHITSALMTSLGKKTGRYTSPHLLEWNERIAVDNVPISDESFDRLIAEIDASMAAIEQEHPTLGPFNAFELLTAAAFVHFRSANCDIAVVEVGLGGRFDSTNHVQPLVSVITRIEAEHVDVLGPTIADIAWNKAGIIKPDRSVVVTRQRSAVDVVIKTAAEHAGAPLLREDREWQVREDSDAVIVRTPAHQRRVRFRSLPGEHNRSNLGAALVAIELATNDTPISDDHISDTLATLRIPGRFEHRIEPRTGRKLILDVAHTPESLAAVVQAITTLSGAHSFPILLSLLSDKPAAELLALIAPVAEQVLFPAVANPRAIEPAALQALATRLGIRSTVAASVQAALGQLRPGLAPVLVTGSFSIVAETHRALAVDASSDT